MSFWMLLGVAVGLGMDAFAVAIATGVKLCRPNLTQTMRMAGAFGFFQFTMSVIGWKAASVFVGYFRDISHWIACILLLLVGLHMIWDSMQGADRKRKSGDPTKGWILLTLAIATSIDALVVGIGFSVLETPIFWPAGLIGLVAAGMTVVGLEIGCRFGLALGKRMEILGGLILAGIGIKILVGHF
ncbi:manganese efflux pump MntP family protein [bacterium]|nr:manganese efflux pump MntP family protein [bacterium]